jgi:hypothetical protein
MHHFLTHLTFRIKQFFRLPADVVAHPQVRQNFPRNFLNNSLDGIFWMLGESFVSVSAILPVFASTLTQSPILIGLVPALINAGWFIPQLLTAGHVKRLPQKFPFAKRMAILERVPFIALPFTAFLLNWFPRQVVIWFFMIIVAWRGFASGMVALPWQEVIALVIPSEVRSRFFGFSRTAARSMAVIGSALAGLILANINFPNNYGLSFSIGAVFIWLSYFFFSQTVEPTASHKKIITEADQKKHLLIDIPGFKAVLKEDKNFRSYLLSRVFFQLGSMATGFFAVYGIKNFNLSDEQAAIFSGILFTSSIFGVFYLGAIRRSSGSTQPVIDLRSGADAPAGPIHFCAIYLCFLLGFLAFWFCAGRLYYWRTGLGHGAWPRRESSNLPWFGTYHPWCFYIDRAHHWRGSCDLGWLSSHVLSCAHSNTHWQPISFKG